MEKASKKIFWLSATNLFKWRLGTHFIDSLQRILCPCNTLLKIKSSSFPHFLPNKCSNTSRFPVKLYMPHLHNQEIRRDTGSNHLESMKRHVGAKEVSSRNFQTLPSGSIALELSIVQPPLLKHLSLRDTGLCSSVASVLPC